MDHSLDPSLFGSNWARTKRTSGAVRWADGASTSGTHRMVRRSSAVQRCSAVSRTGPLASTRRSRTVSSRRLKCTWNINYRKFGGLSCYTNLSHVNTLVFLKTELMVVVHSRFVSEDGAVRNWERKRRRRKNRTRRFSGTSTDCASIIRMIVCKNKTVKLKRQKIKFTRLAEIKFNWIPPPGWSA